jgi:hypothetical protein
MTRLFFGRAFFGRDGTLIRSGNMVAAACRLTHICRRGGNRD